MAKLDLTKGPFAEDPVSKSGQQLREEKDQDKHIVILALNTVLLTKGGEKSSPCPQAENTTTIKINKSKQKKV